MFKGKKGSSSPKSKLPSSNYVSKDAACLHDAEYNISASFKKSKKKKNFFNSIRNKISSVLEGKNKGAADHTYVKTSRSKSFEVLNNIFEESHERSSSSEDSVLDRSKWGSKRSQSVRNKQTVCPAEFGSPQVASNPLRTGFQSEDNETDRSSSAYRENDIHWTNSFINNGSSVRTPSSIGPHTEPFLDRSTCCQSENAKHLETNEEVQKDINIGKNTLSNIQNSISNSPQCKEVAVVNYRALRANTSYLGIDEEVCKSLAEEIRELGKYGWYWGPLNRNEAEEKLADQPDGAFLVRDSSDVKYLLSLSFRSYDKTLHTRIEHSNGWFSFYPHPEHDRHRSLVGLINHCISKSDEGVFCYSRPLMKGSPSFPVRLTKPVSRFMQVRSLQYLCRFVIRQYTSINHIQNLPIPPQIQGYLKESYY